TRVRGGGGGRESSAGAEAVRLVGDTSGRRVDVVIVNPARPRASTLERYAQEHRAPLEVGDVPPSCEIVAGDFWCEEIARHDRRRLAQAVWAVLARKLL